MSGVTETPDSVRYWALMSVSHAYGKIRWQNAIDAISATEEEKIYLNKQIEVVNSYLDEHENKFVNFFIQNDYDNPEKISLYIDEQVQSMLIEKKLRK